MLNLQIKRCKQIFLEIINLLLNIFGAGSENVYLVDIKNYNIIKKKIKLNSTYFVEKFYPGDEYIVDGFKHKTKLTFYLLPKRKKYFFQLLM